MAAAFPTEFWASVVDKALLDVSRGDGSRRDAQRSYHHNCHGVECSASHSTFPPRKCGERQHCDARTAHELSSTGQECREVGAGVDGKSGYYYWDSPQRTSNNSNHKHGILCRIFHHTSPGHYNHPGARRDEGALPIRTSVGLDAVGNGVSDSCSGSCSSDSSAESYSPYTSGFTSSTQGIEVSREKSTLRANDAVQQNAPTPLEPDADDAGLHKMEPSAPESKLKDISGDIPCNKDYADNPIASVNPNVMVLSTTEAGDAGLPLINQEASGVETANKDCGNTSYFQISECEELPVGGGVPLVASSEMEPCLHPSDTVIPDRVQPLSATSNVIPRPHCVESQTVQILPDNVVNCGVEAQSSECRDRYINLMDTVVESGIVGSVKAMSKVDDVRSVVIGNVSTLGTTRFNDLFHTGNQFLHHSLRGAQLLKCCKRSYIVGKGATAVVRLCNRVDTNKKYAIKEFRKRRRCETEREYIKKLVSEFCISSSLKNENVVSTIDLIQDKKRQWCVVMEYCAGGDLHTRINSGTLKLTAEINCYLKQLAQGVGYLHSVGVAHRDIKPENLLLSQDGRILKIADFGVSAVFRGPFCSVSHKTRGLCGSGPYIAPEQFLSDEYDPRVADVWSIAIVYYVMVYGTAPWKCASSCDSRYKRYAKSPSTYPLIQRLKPGPCEIIGKMLNPDPSKRPDMPDVLANKWFKLISICSESSDQKESNHEHHVVGPDDH